MVVKLQLLAGFSDLLSTKAKLEQRWVETTSFRPPAPSPCLVGLWDFFVLLHLLCLFSRAVMIQLAQIIGLRLLSEVTGYSVKPKNVWSEEKGRRRFVKNQHGNWFSLKSIQLHCQFIQMWK